MLSLQQPRHIPTLPNREVGGICLALQRGLNSDFERGPSCANGRLGSFEGPPVDYSVLRYGCGVTSRISVAILPRPPGGK